MIRGDLAVLLAVSFCGGFAVRDLIQDRYDEEKMKLTAEEVRKCQAYEGYLVMTLDGKTTKCRALMIRADWMYPLPAGRVR